MRSGRDRRCSRSTSPRVRPCRGDIGVRLGENDFVTPVIDSDQHLYETRTTWLDHIDPAHRDDALRIVDDELGYPWLSWGPDRKLGPVDVQMPGQTSELGERRERIRAGLLPESRYDDVLPRNYWDA